MNSHKVLYWESECNDCGFVSGLASVELSDGRKFLITGAGCFSRRDLSETKRIVQNIIETGKFK